MTDYRSMSRLDGIKLPRIRVKSAAPSPVILHHPEKKKAPKDHLERIINRHASYFQHKDWRRVKENAGISIKTDDIIELLHKAPSPRDVRGLVRDMQ